MDRSRRHCTLAMACVWPAMACMVNPLADRRQPHAAAQPKIAALAAVTDRGKPAFLTPDEWRATREATDELKAKLKWLSQTNAFALGNEDSTAYGIGWHGDPDRSDIKSVCGAHPAVYGWDLFGIELGQPQNGDGVDFDLICQRMQEAHRSGGINAVSWHTTNPVTGGTAWDCTRAVPDILPGGGHHERFVGYLDRVATFFQDCRGDRGELLPVVFRPFHEHTASWFWWGANTTTAEEYTSLFRLVVGHLRETRSLRQLLFALSPVGADVQSPGMYLFRYPGDDYLDVLGVDFYYEEDASMLVRALEVAVDLADARGKVAALTEFGIKGGLSTDRIPVEHWFTQSFLWPLRQSAKAGSIAYALAWRNARLDHFFVPYPQHPSAADFRAVCDDPAVLLAGELTGGSSDITRAR